MNHIFFYAKKKFPDISSWNSGECTMQLITQTYRSKLESVRDSDIDRMMKSFQDELKKRYRIPVVLVEKYKDELCFMVEIDFTCMEVVVP